MPDKSGMVQWLAIGGSRDGQIVKGHNVLGVKFPAPLPPPSVIEPDGASLDTMSENLKFEQYHHKWISTKNETTHFFVLDGLTMTDVIRKLVANYAK